ncbi:DUF438 domain-containing protein [Hallella mizrahii]|uniref:DUF438 domain-containing protein n=1 Tax=Hallella mizrahii TaxID=2606637 RepID=A0A7K0KJE5_9BACT|nr:DUF438 domain-containing protein [Hallella mizrahii]MST85600.1 DUF438 domain-containing protein [Hallella mizrahii]
MEKKIDLTQTVYQLTQAYPELIDIMASLGFSEITKKAIRMSVGKLMTISQGAAMRGIGMEAVVKALEDNGFTVVGNHTKSDEPSSKIQEAPVTDTTQQIKSLLRRINEGESMESVRADFVSQFKDVPANDIMRAEQELISEGQSVNEVKKLCDVHSALFHGKNNDEDVYPHLHHGLHHDQEAMMVGQASENRDKTAELRAIDGHPLQTFYHENEAIVEALGNVLRALDGEEDVTDVLRKASGLAVHYAKKGDLIYPLLKTKHGIYGPSQVMWTIDDEIRAEFTTLLRQSAKEDGLSDDWKNRVKDLIGRAREMTFKENRILFPVCTANFTDEEWRQIYVDSKAYPECLGITIKTWEDGEALFREEKQRNSQPVTDAADELRVDMPGGSLTLSQLAALLDTLPLEITFVDAENINRYFNQPFSEKSFKRPLAALGREVFSCHPPKIEPMVRAIIADLRAGKRDSVSVWMEKNQRATLVTYHAVRDSQGQYVGTMETVQDMEEARKHFSQK